MSQPTIQISAPVRNREKYLPHYLKAIYNQNYDKKLITLRFLLNDSVDMSESILWKFKQEHDKEYHKIIIDKWDTNCPPEDGTRETNVRINYIYQQLSKMRNKLLRDNKADYMLSLDTDIMLTDKDTIVKLVESNKQIISAVIINGYHVADGKDAEKFTNILRSDGNGSYKHIRNFRGKGIIPVDFTGAIILISRDVSKNTKVQYEHDIWGEDLPFCLSAQEQGFELFCNTDVRATHCMTEDYLERYIKGEFIFE